MPIYEYKCRSCGHQFEKIVKINENPDCVACQSSDLEKLFNAPGIRTTKSQRRSETQERADRSKVHKDIKVAESDFLKKELSHDHSH
ncbi:MAG: FmdB family zinc ribbon protein [Pseudohongiellaceae bacterium]|jgi:putative FmdB family regulatory protein